MSVQEFLLFICFISVVVRGKKRPKATVGRKLILTYGSRGISVHLGREA